MKPTLPNQETDRKWQLADSSLLTSPLFPVTLPHPGSSTRTATAPELVETDSQKKTKACRRCKTSSHSSLMGWYFCGENVCPHVHLVCVHRLV